jgi:ankyrin repeat protein
METFFDMDKSHWAAWLRVPHFDVYWDSFSNFQADDAGPLYYAALCGFYDLVEYLVCKYPGHINARGGRLATPLVAALHGKHFQVAELLFRHGAEVDVRGTLGYTPLNSACWAGPADIVRWLLNHGADVNSHTELRVTSLHSAALSGRLKAAQILLEHGADISARNAWGEAALHLAACGISKDHQDRLATMQLLLESGADVNARNDVGLTPLHHSSCRELRTKVWCDRRIYAGPCHTGTVEGSKLLLKHGADMDARDDEGRTPLDLALEHGRDEIARFLLEYGATRPR